MKADLHCHSHLSDGKHSLEFLVQRATANGVTHLAITDHDYTHPTFDTEAIQALTLINGVEISCDWHNLDNCTICSGCVSPQCVASG